LPEQLVLQEQQVILEPMELQELLTQVIQELEGLQVRQEQPVILVLPEQLVLQEQPVIREPMVLLEQQQPVIQEPMVLLD